MIKNKLNAFSKVFKIQQVMAAALCTTVLALTSACSSLSTSTDAAAPSVAKDTPPNILLILSDDHAWSDYGFMGHEIVKTPALDKLANEGVTFKRAYVPTSLCRPSLATIATGLYASQHGITGNNPSQKVPGGKKGETYNIGGRNERTNLQIVDTITTILDEQVPKETSYKDLITFVEDRAGHDRRYAIDATKLETELGWKADENFDTGIVKTIEWYLNKYGMRSL